MAKKIEKVRTAVEELWPQLIQTETEMEMGLKKSHYYWI
jgi:hypothetical protein